MTTSPISSDSSKESTPIEAEERAYQCIQTVLTRAFVHGGLDQVLQVCGGLIREADNVRQIGTLGKSEEAAQRIDLANFINHVWSHVMLDRLDDADRTGTLTDPITGEEKLARIADVIQSLNLVSKP